MLEQESLGSAPYSPKKKQQHKLRLLPKQQTEQYALGNPYGLCQTPEVYRDIMTHYPPLLDDRSFQKLFEYLFLGPAKFDDSDHIIISNFVLAKLEDKLAQWHSGNYDGEAFLIRFRDATGIKIKWSNYLPPIPKSKSKTKGPPRARVITELGIPDDLLERINKCIYQSNELVYFRSGLKRTSERLTESYARTLERAARAGRLNFRTDEQRLMADMLHAVPMSKYVATVNAHKSEADTRLEELQGIIGDERRETHGRPRQRRILNTIVAYPKPWYHPVSNSYRLYASGLTLVDRRVRWQLTPDWIELDLKSAHAAIASVLWDFVPLWEALSNGLSLWEHLLEHLGVRNDLWKRVKPCVKMAFYATLYGMDENAIDRTFWKNLNKEFKQDGKRPYIPNRLIDNELIQTVIQARDAEMERVINEGGTLTPFGYLALDADWHEEDGDDIRKTLKRHLSHVASAYELKLIAPVFEVAANRSDHDVSITLYQFDGVSIEVRPSRRERVISAMQKAVRSAADQYGIPTRLEVTEKEVAGEPIAGEPIAGELSAA